MPIFPKNTWLICILFAPMLLGAAEFVKDPHDNVQIRATKTNTLDALPYTDVAKAIQVPPGSPQFSIKLKSNPSTGFAWYLVDQHPQLIEAKSHKYYPSTDAKIGSGGYEVWVFKLAPEAFVVPELLTVKMQYVRSFDVTSAQHKSFSVVTSVLSAKAKKAQKLA